VTQVQDTHLHKGDFVWEWLWWRVTVGDQRW